MKLNVGAGQSLPDGSEWEHIDIHPQMPNVREWDVDNGLPYADNTFDEVRVYGCLSEFKQDVVFHMNEYWRVLQNGGVLDIINAVVDNGLGAFRDPLARRYLHSQWVQYFAGDTGWVNSGKGFGFRGKFEFIKNEVSGESHHVILKAIK